MTAFTLNQYLQRIQFHGEVGANLDTVAAMMRCQLMNVPFENLDVQAGKIISLDHHAIVEKILDRQRGGYCYEVNGLFAMALDALHIPYFFVAARPLAHGAKKPKTHMAIIVSFGAEQWLCDCGYGGYGIRAPLRLHPTETEVDQDGDLFMLSANGEQELVLKTCINGEWEPQYSFNLAPQIWVDFIPANYYNSTHHDSIFVRKLLVVICTATGRKILFGNSLKIISNGQQEKISITPENRAAILREEFGLVDPSFPV